jgi:Zn-dependent M28 family amino/carboxypeptidase
VKFSYNVYRETKSSKNLIGIIEGTDSELKNEFITIGAHYDHEGIINGVVYNGADDNASGTVAILEAARRLVDLNNNKRSILIIFHAAEEKGLLGSKYLTSNSDFMENVIVNINADMVGRKHVDSIYSIGSDKLSSELKNIVEDVNEETVNFVFNYRFDEPNDPQRLYYRSDHYNYAKQNIPVVFFYDYMLEDYSKPTDTPDKINYEKVEKISTLVTHLALKISNLDHRLRVDVKEEIEEIR